MADLSQLNLLINLARIDGEVATEEVVYLTRIAKANNISEDEIVQMLKADQLESIQSEMNDEERLNVLVKLVQLMKADGKLYKEEIRYCSKIASRLGYNEEVLFDLMLHVTSTDLGRADFIRIKNITKKHLQ